MSETKLQVLGFFLQKFYIRPPVIVFHVFNAVFDVRWTMQYYCVKVIFIAKDVSKIVLKMAFLTACKTSGAIPT